MHTQFKSISLSYQTASLAVREQVALSQDEAKALMLSLRDAFELQDLLVVSTCNRTEIYYASPNNHSTDIVKMLLIHKGLLDVEQYLPYFQLNNNHASSVRYLFEVSLGLHSKVVGDLQIPNQIKHAYQWSADLGMAGPFLHRLMHTIFFANKKVTQETGFRDGAAEVGFGVALERGEHEARQFDGAERAPRELDRSIGSHPTLEGGAHTLGRRQREVPRGLADEDLAAFEQAYDGRGEHRSVRVADQTRRAVLEDGHERVGGPQVDAQVRVLAHRRSGARGRGPRRAGMSARVCGGPTLSVILASARSAQVCGERSPGNTNGPQCSSTAGR